MQYKLWRLLVHKLGGGGVTYMRVGGLADIYYLITQMVSSNVIQVFHRCDKSEWSYEVENFAICGIMETSHNTRFDM